MAWFKKNDGQSSADIPMPVTINRVGALFDRKEWTYELKDERILTGFDGFFTGLRIVDDTFLSISVAASHSSLTADRGEELQQWAESRNRDGSIGTVQVMWDSDDDSFMVLSDHSLLINKGATDNQIEVWVEACIDAQLTHMMSLRETFDLPSPSES